MTVGRVDFTVVEAVARCEAKTADEVARCVHFEHDDGADDGVVSCKWRGSNGDDFVCERYERLVEDINDYIEKKLGILEET